MAYNKFKYEISDLIELMKFLKKNKEFKLLNELKYELKFYRELYELNEILDIFITMYYDELKEIKYIKEI